MIPCAVCGLFASCALEAAKKDSGEMMWSMAFCKRCSELFCRFLLPLRNPNITHFIYTKLVSCLSTEMN